MYTCENKSGCTFRFTCESSLLYKSGVTARLNARLTSAAALKCLRSGKCTRIGCRRSKGMFAMVDMSSRGCCRSCDMRPVEQTGGRLCMVRSA
jgi:hypothetical protein